MTDKLKAMNCPCGSGIVPQLKIIRIPETHKAVAYVLFCLGGCHREGVGMTEAQAIENWNLTLVPKKDEKEIYENYNDSTEDVDRFNEMKGGGRGIW